MIELFDGLVASESRFWDALDQGLLRPFHDFGVNDPTNLAAVKFQRGRYFAGHLDDVLTSDHVRALRIRQADERLVTDPNRMRALGFGAGVGPTRFMAKHFGRAG